MSGSPGDGFHFPRDLRLDRYRIRSLWNGLASVVLRQFVNESEVES